MDLRSLRYVVAVVEECHIGRAATRLHMTQPPLSRAIRDLENELGVTIFERTAKGVTPTAAGVVLYDEAKDLLQRVARLRERVEAAATPTALTIGTLADAAAHVGGPLITLFRERHPDIRVSVHEADLSDPTAGLRAGLVDLALTRTPFDDHGIQSRVLRSVGVGVVMREDDPLSTRDAITITELADRRWVRLPTTDRAWTSYWTGGPHDDTAPVLRTIQECLQAVLWNGTTALAPVDQPLPAGLVAVPCTDRPPSDLVVAWSSTVQHPLIRSFVRIAAHAYGDRPSWP